MYRNGLSTVMAAVAVSSAMGASEPAAAGREAVRPQVIERLDGKIVAGDLVFDSWRAYAHSEFFNQRGARCGTVPSRIPVAEGGSGADCSFTLTNPAAIYDPSVARYRVPVVVHVIQNTSGSGAISDAMVQSQIDILNEDFLAIFGTNGANGTNLEVEFYLATVDPTGSPTNGITRSTNDTWFNDGGAYWDALAWNTNLYLNIYTNTASGNLGYVPDLPQGGIAGSNADRVVILWSSFGRNGPIGPPFDQGRTATHEVGHYMGLEHTFSGGCGTASCYTTSDLICDTNPEASPTSGCTDANSCSTPDPIRNYMDYSDDLCMEEFTFEQARRMRCSLEHYRPAVYAVGGAVCGDGIVQAGEQCDDGNTIPGDGCDANCQFEHTCGNGVLEPGEQCDDGNTIPGDGCDANCQLEPVCGNGVLEAGEQCDDGNTIPGDGCDANCQLEGIGHNCCTTGHGSGCTNATISSCVCAVDPYCCNTDWDSICVGEVESLGCGSCSGPVCGNGVIETGEQCDDGNTIPGDGCDANCQIEVTDTCANATTITNGATAFDTTGATTDGPAHLACDDGFGDTQVGSDIWFDYTATCTGNLTVDTCGTAAYDTKIAVYSGCACPPTTLLGCDDDTTGCAGNTSQVVTAATAGICYKIRVGGFNGATGTGTLNVSCAPVVCTPPNCDDGNPCTTDVCNAGTCVNTPNTLPCDDLDPCTVGDSCQSGVCAGGGPVDCSAAGDECNTASCDSGSIADNCSILTPANEGNPCNSGTGVCQSGTCVPTNAGNTRVFMVRPGMEAMAPTSGATTITVAQGGIATIEVWVADTEAQQLGNYQTSTAGIATPQGGATGTVAYIDNADATGCDSLLVDITDPDWVFFADQPTPFCSETGLPDGIAFAANLPLGSGHVVTLGYLGEFQFAASPSALGTFTLDFLALNQPPNGGSFMVDETGVGPIFALYQPLDIVVVESVPCATAADCADLNTDSITDDVCVWWECNAGLCNGVPKAHPSDMGSPFGGCPIDSFCNLADALHALTCFASTNACDAINIDAGGAFGDCVPDGFCNLADALHALTCFAGTNPCNCGPSPEAREPNVVGSAALTAVADRRAVRAGDEVSVRVFATLQSPERQRRAERASVLFRAYQLHTAVTGGRSGALELTNIEIEDRADAVFASNADTFNAFNTETSQMLAGLFDGSVATSDRVYLATFTYRVSPDAVGTFVIDVLHDGASENQTFLVGADQTDKIEVTRTVPAVIVATQGEARSIR